MSLMMAAGAPPACRRRAPAAAPRADAGAGRAAPAQRLVEPLVGRADQRAAVLGEEFVRPEVEGSADVRAAIHVRAKPALVIHDERVHQAPGALEAKRRAPAGRHRRGGAAPLV